MRTLLAATMIVAASAAQQAAGSSEGRHDAAAALSSSSSFPTTSDEFRSISQFVSSELHPALAANKDGSTSSIGSRSSSDGRHRSLEDTTSTYFADFDDICEEMRLIFNQQCSCGAVAEERSDMVTCQSGSSGGLEASAHFDSESFALETIEVCKQQACTVIHYQNRTGTRCEATYGDSGGQTCGSCRVCTAGETDGGAMMGLEIDCTNVNPQMSVNCTAVSEILDLSGAVGGGRWAAAVGAAASSVALLAVLA